MATKKECDRCGRQWNMPKGIGTFVDVNLCNVTFELPEWRQHAEGRGISKKIEMCQECAREVYHFATNHEAKT